MNTKRATEGSILNRSEGSGTTDEGLVMRPEEQPQVYILSNNLHPTLHGFRYDTKGHLKSESRKEGDKPW